MYMRLYWPKAEALEGQVGFTTVATNGFWRIAQSWIVFAVDLVCYAHVGRPKSLEGTAFYVNSRKIAIALTMPESARHWACDRPPGSNLGICLALRPSCPETGFWEISN
jgi:hypothetical protein